jgi:hypothetical protein
MLQQAELREIDTARFDLLANVNSLFSFVQWRRRKLDVISGYSGEQ